MPDTAALAARSQTTVTWVREHAHRTRNSLFGLPQDTPDEVDLPLHAIAGPLTYDGEKVRAWYVLHPTQWAFKSGKQQQAVIDEHMLAYAALAGRSLVGRRLPREVSIATWAAQYDAQHPNVPDREAWAEQRVRTIAWLGERPRHHPQVLLGVEVTDRRTLDRAVTWLAERTRHGNTTRSTNREHRIIQAALSEVDKAAGLIGRPATGPEVAELVHRSVALGMPLPRDLTTGAAYEGTDLLEFTDGLVTDPRPGRDAIHIVSEPRRTGHRLERWVSVVALGRCEDLDIPGANYPWIAYNDRLGFPIEWAWHFNVLTPQDAMADILNKIKVVNDQRQQYRLHPELDVPPELDMTDAKAREVRVHLTRSHPIHDCKARGIVLAGIIGRTEEECLDRRDRFILHNRAQQQQYHVAHAQNGQARAFIPGGQPVSQNHLRRMDLDYFVTAVPTVESALGDGEGMALGHTDGTVKQPVFWGRHKALLDEMTGLTPVGGVPGCGKTTLLADIAHEGSTAGESWTVVDPSGPLRHMVTLPEYRGGLAYNLDLLSADPGSVSPFSLIPEPRRTQYADDGTGEKEYRAAVIAARTDRTTLALDLMRGALPYEVAYAGGTEPLLRKALRLAAGGRADASCAQVQKALEDMGGNAADLAGHLADAAEHPTVQVFWQAGDPTASLAAYRLVVINIAGFVMPDPHTERREWGVRERMSMVAALLASHVAAKRLYDAPMEELKGFEQDEAHVLSLSPSGKALVSRIDRDSRKWRIRALMATHNPQEFIEGGMENRIAEVFIGQTEDPAAQKAALRLLRVQPGCGYEDDLARLSPLDAEGNRPPWRRFVMRDTRGRVDVFRTDMAHKRHLLAAISPKGSRAARQVINIRTDTAA